MKCLYCGHETGEDFIYCPNCGKSVDDAPAVSLNPTADKVLCALKDKMFLAICILMSASCVASLLCSSIQIISILLTIFLWITYSQAAEGCADPNNLRRVSGTVYASYVVGNVVAGILIVCGLVVAAAIGFMKDYSDLIDNIYFELNNAPIDLDAIDITAEFISTMGWVIGLMFVAIGVLVLVMNILGIRKIHRFVKSIYQGILCQNPNFENPRAAKNWIIVFAVLSSVSVVFSINDLDAVGLVANGTLIAAEIISAIMIDKYFLSNEK